MLKKERRKNDLKNNNLYSKIHTRKKIQNIKNWRKSDMAYCINKGNASFEVTRNSYYVDKSKLIEILNNSINTKNNMFCISRPRRFGKSITAEMLLSYYDYTCDSHALFDDLEISKTENYEKHINKYNVIFIDVTTYMSEEFIQYSSYDFLADSIKKSIKADLVEKYKELKKEKSLITALKKYYEKDGKKFVFVIDEWDAPMRDSYVTIENQKKYLDFLRSLFKSSEFTSSVIACVYMTGILPIKTDGTQSALSNFQSYSIINPGPFAPYTGFTENEVKKICDDFNMDFKETKKWYDGYKLSNGLSLYNPYAVMRAMNDREFHSYWVQTSTMESLKSYITLNYYGLQNDIAALIAGKKVSIDTSNFQNDTTTFFSKDDVLTILVHFGYLSYDQNTKQVKIPNEEIKNEFYTILKISHQPELLKYIEYSKEIYKATIDGNGEKVGQMLNEKFIEHFSLRYYNDEQGLKSLVRMAYITCMDEYCKFEEIAGGKGIVDMLLVPKSQCPVPPIIIEFKWNNDEKNAIHQIKEKEYYKVLRDYSGDVVLVGINYDKNSKQHKCEIEKGVYMDGQYMEKKNILEDYELSQKEIIIKQLDQIKENIKNNRYTPDAFQEEMAIITKEIEYFKNGEFEKYELEYKKHKDYIAKINNINDDEDFDEKQNLDLDMIM